jgi:hypothetical protein
MGAHSAGGSVGLVSHSFTSQHDADDRGKVSSALTKALRMLLAMSLGTGGVDVRGGRALLH